MHRVKIRPYSHYKTICVWKKKPRPQEISDISQTSHTDISVAYTNLNGPQVLEGEMLNMAYPTGNEQRRAVARRMPR